MSIASSINMDESSGITYLNIDNDFAQAKISLYGGHVLSYIPKSDATERLWLSPHAVKNGDKPIRGGVPVCWPWFSDDHGRAKGDLPAHGFLRSQVWKIVSSQDTPEGTELIMSPSYTRADGFEYDCDVTLTVFVGATLTLSLQTVNKGLVPFTFNTALHTYFQVANIADVQLDGLIGDYKDKNDNWAVKTTPPDYRIEKETDRIHLDPAKQVVIKENTKPFTRINSSGHDSIVVWNPWQGAASISDMDAFGYKHMICVESACTQNISLAPDEQHTLTQIIHPV
jgi:glucose-6-phosphate 1-epimerase